MGKTFRVKILIIVAIFAVITSCGIFGAYALGERLALSALYYGSGTADDPYRIYTSAQLSNLQEITDSSKAKEYTQDKYFKLYADVSSTRKPTENYNSKGFYGHFDGNGYSVTVADYGIFYRLADGASMTDLTVKIDLKMNFDNLDDKYGICYRTEKGATIENCKVVGDIEVDPTALANKQTDSLYVAGYCIVNNGTIKDCEFTGNITESSTAYLVGTLWATTICATNAGTVENCTVNCDMDLIVGAARYYAVGVARGAVNCVYNGNIRVSANPDNRWAGAVGVYVIGLGASVTDCVFNGDITFDHLDRSSNKLSLSIDYDTSSTFTHNGEIIELNKP